MYFRCFENTELKGSHAYKSIAVVYILFRWCFLKNQGTLCPVFSHYIRVRKAQKYCMSETFPAASLDLLPKLIEILLTEHSTSLWYLTLQNSFEGLGWIMKETRASGVHYLPHFMRRFYKVCCLPFQIHDRNKYKAWKERASQSCLLPSPLPPLPFSSCFTGHICFISATRSSLSAQDTCSSPFTDCLFLLFFFLLGRASQTPLGFEDDQREAAQRFLFSPFLFSSQTDKDLKAWIATVAALGKHMWNVRKVIPTSAC